VETRILTTEEVADILQVDKSTVKRWTIEGKLNCERTPGGHRKFTPQVILDFAVAYKYRTDQVRNRLADADPALTLRQLLHERNGSSVQQVILSASLRADKTAMFDLFTELTPASLTLAQLTGTLVIPVFAGIDRLAAGGKIDADTAALAKNSVIGALQMLDVPRPSARDDRRPVLLLTFTPELAPETRLLEHLYERSGYRANGLGSVSGLSAVLRIIDIETPQAVICVIRPEHNTEPVRSSITALLAAGASRSVPVLCDAIGRLAEADPGTAAGGAITAAGRNMR